MASKYRKKFSLPEGFYPVVENYCREVLRDQPQDIIEFSYLYFKACEEGNIETFNYPKKGQNIPPDRNERPVSMDEYDDEEEDKEYDQEQDQDQNEEYGDEEAQSYYDEAGNKVEGNPDQEVSYGEEEGQNEEF